MSALEIKPGKYRARDGYVVTVKDRADKYWSDFGYAWRAVSYTREDVFLTAAGRFRSRELYKEQAAHDAPLDLIERIEDEQPSAIVGAVECSVMTGMPIRGRASRFPDNDFHVSYGARDAIRAHDGDSYEHQMSTAVKWCAARNLKLVAMTEYGPPIYPPEKAELEAKIARLEAENESLSRQMRSRELNREPATTGKVWRWSPMV